MIFNSFEFIWLFPLIFCVYYFIVYAFKQRRNNKIENSFLLVVSYSLILKWEPFYAFILFYITLVTYFSAIFIEHKKAYKNNHYIIGSSLILSLIPLLYFKYYNFITSSLISFLHLFNFNIGLSGINYAIPIGISFYTLQAIGYLLDVYNNKIKAERNWWDYMLFVCFFPQILSGPISKAQDLIPQIKSHRVFNESQAAEGLKLILWGLFLKVVVADRLGITINYIYDDYLHQSGLFVSIACFLYSFQIYGDFAGYSLMAIGVGKLMGINLINNFQRPYLSTSITNFWHRWHISLSIWLKDYIYIPLGGNKCSKIKNYRNILLTFLVSGIWHGANITFIVWGLIHGILQSIEKILKLNKDNSHGIKKILKIAITFILISFSWVFFRMPTCHDAIMVIKKMTIDFSIGIDVALPTIFWCFSLVTIVFLKDIVDEYNITKLKLLHSHSRLVRWCTYITITLFILFTGIFDAGQFIYAGF